MSNQVSKEQEEEWRIDPNNWKWGMFYYNKDDQRIFPPKKLKAWGWTVNFANPWSIFSFVVLFTAIIVVSKLIVSL